MVSDVPSVVVKQLKRGQPYELDWGVVLRPPSDPSSSGAAGAYRWDYYDPPVRSDGSRGARRGSSARSLETAWRKANAKVAELEARMQAQQTGHRLDATFGELADHYLEPSRHPEWNGVNHASKVRSVARNWLLDDRIVVTDTSDVRAATGGELIGACVPLRDVQLGRLTPAMLIEALGLFSRHGRMAPTEQPTSV